MFAGKRNIIRDNVILYERWFQGGIKSRLQEMTLPASKVKVVLSVNYQQIITVTAGQETARISTPPVTHTVGINP